MTLVTPLWVKQNCPFIIDQRFLPHQEQVEELKSLEDVYLAIKLMKVRGAPLIGFTAIWGMILFARNQKSFKFEELEAAGQYLNTSRPTAVNLSYEVMKCLSIAKKHYNDGLSSSGLEERLLEYFQEQWGQLKTDLHQMALIAEQELAKKISHKKKWRLMTLCNTGSLACGPGGTALGVISHINDQGLLEWAYASETRPYLQGARLTSYEMLKLGINHEIVVEGSFSYLLGKGLVDAIFIGADRIANNGDTANKVGSSTLAIVAHHFGVPFYVVAPMSSFDLSLSSGEEIPIELRDQREITDFQGEKVAPLAARALNPSFDITSNKHITGIISERGIFYPGSENIHF